MSSCRINIPHIGAKTSMLCGNLQQIHYENGQMVTRGQCCTTMYELLGGLALAWWDIH